MQTKVHTSGLGRVATRSSGVASFSELIASTEFAFSRLLGAKTEFCGVSAILGVAYVRVVRLFDIR